jgi:hypothetical protein
MAWGVRDHPGRWPVVTESALQAERSDKKTTLLQRFLPIAAIAVSLAAGAPAGVRGQDIVDYYDPASKLESKTEQIRGTIESENPLGIKVKPRTGPVKAIAAEDIRYIRYKSSVPDLDYRNPFRFEDRALGQTKDEARRKLLADALQGYRDVQPRLKDSPAASRYFQYRIARVLALQAEDNREKLDAAIAAFAAFGKEHVGGWEIVAALKQLARLREEKGDLAAAGEAYADLARVPGITPRVRVDSEILGARMLLRAGRADDAEKKLTALDTTLSGGEAAKPAVQVFLAQCRLARGDLANVEAPVRTALAATADASVLAAGHNTLGDYYLKKSQPEDAFWEYLRVDVEYGEDREEEAKALFYLSQLFDKVKNDKVRAGEFLARLQDKGQFGGTEYHKKAAAKP